MIRWSETRRVLEAARRTAEGGGRAALATVIRVTGSGYRREGAKLLVLEDSSSVGNVSGGCLEDDVREVGLRVIGTRVPETRRYSSSTDAIEAWDLGLGCPGEVLIHVEPFDTPLDVELQRFRSGDPFVTLTLIGTAPGVQARTVLLPDGRIAGAERGWVDGELRERALRHLDDRAPELFERGGIELFIEGFVPPPRLLIFGAGYDAVALAKQAGSAGFQIAVVDRRPALLDPDRFPSGSDLRRWTPDGAPTLLPLDDRTYVVVMSHSFTADLEFLRVAARSDVPYLGLLGPRSRGERLLELLGSTGSADSRVRGPVGLDIGAEGAEQVAISILAEVLAVRSGRSGVPLRDRKSPIHVEF